MSGFAELPLRIVAILLGIAFFILGVQSLRHGIPIRFEVQTHRVAPAVAILAVLVGPALVLLGVARRRLW